ncbi:MAG: MerR family transcriptional regulator [Leptospirales bacterium]
MAQYTVGKLAQIVNVSTDTVRLYEKMGLLKAMRGENRYRYFSQDSLQRIQFIRKFQKVGFTLEEISIFLGLPHKDPQLCPEVKKILEQKNSQLEKQIREMTSISSMLKEFIEQCSQPKEGTDCPMIEEFHATFL